MNSQEEQAGKAGAMQRPDNGVGLDFEQDAELRQALGNFRQSVVAWSEAAYSRPRTALAARRSRVWRLATGWALGCALLAGAVGGGVQVRHQRQVAAQIAAEQAIAQKKLAAEQRAKQEEELLAKVDDDIARQTPSAMEPLDSLMAEDDNK